MAQDPILTVLTVDLPAAVLERARAISSKIQLVLPEEYKLDPRRLEEAEVALVLGWPEQLRLQRASCLRWVQTVGAGVERLLTPEILARRDLIVTNASGVHAQPIAEQVFGYLLMFSRHLHGSLRDQASARWDGESHYPELHTLRGKTLGLLGLGAIGRRIAEIAPAFGLKVLGLRRHPEPIPGIELHGPEALHALLARSDFIVNSLPLTSETRGLLGPEAFAATKRGAFFVNVGRGASVDTSALLHALEAGILAGAGLDVTEPEPLPPEHPLWRQPNVIITPHYAGVWPHYFEELGEIFLDNLDRYTAGRPLRNVVDPVAGY